MRSLVLGGGGFVGSWIVRELLQRKEEVVVLKRPHSSEASTIPEGVHAVMGDCCDVDVLTRTMKECDAVFHSAAYYPLYSVHRGTQARQALRELRIVLQAAEVSEVSKFIFTSSPMVLVDDPAVFQRCTYHYIKRMLHDEFLRRIDNGLPGIVAVPGACFGPGDAKPTTGRLIVEIASRRLRFFLDGKMNSVDVRDVAKAEVEMLAKGSIGSVYQLGNWNCTLRDFVTFVANQAGVLCPELSVPYAPIKTLARVVEAIQYTFGVRVPILPCSGLDQIHYGVHLDSTLAQTDFAFAVRPIALTIRDALDYFERVGFIRSISAPRIENQKYGLSYP